MAEVYTLRAPENFNYNNNERHSTPVSIKSNQNSSDQKLEMYYLKPNNDKRTPSPNLFKLPSSPINGNSNDRSLAVSKDKKQKSPKSYQPSHGQKPEMYYLSAESKKTPENTRQSPSTNDTNPKPKLSGILRNGDSANQRRVIVYMVAAPNRNSFLPHIPRTPSPLIHSTKKKPLVSFDTDHHNDKYDVASVHSIALSQSKAIESIQRSMNKYRFRRN